MNNSKTLSTILSALALSLSSSLMAMDIRTQPNNLSPLSSVIPGPEPIDEGAGAAPERNKREARGGGRGGGGRSGGGGGYRGGSYRGSSYRGNSYRGGSYGGGGYKKGPYTYKYWKDGTFRALSKVTSYVKSVRSGIRLNLTKLKKGYSMTTPKKIQVSVNPVGKSLRGSQPINKIDSKVRFRGTESDFLYFTLRAGAAYSLFRLMLMKSEADPSQLYLGYYEEDESRVIDSGSPGLTPAPLLLKDVTVRLNGTESSVNSTALPDYSAQPSGFLLANTTGFPDLSSKKSGLKLFRPLLTLANDQEYSIEVAWKSMEALSSTSMPDQGSMTYTTITPSPTLQTLTTFSTPAADMDGQVPDTPAAIPEDVPTQIIVRNKDGEILTTLNLNLTLSHFSFSDANGQLLEYGINGSRVDLLTKVNTENHYVYDKPDLNKGAKFKAREFAIAMGSIFGGIGVIIGVCVACGVYAKKKQSSIPGAIDL